MKKTLAMILVAVLALSAMSFAAVAEDERETISVVIFDRGSVPADQGSYEDNWATQWINENAPVNVNFIPVARWETYQTYNLWLAAGECADIFMEFQPEYCQEWVNQGMLTELSGLIDEYAPNYRKLTAPEVQAWGIYNGGEYAVVDARPETSVINYMCYIRTDWLENLGLSMPTSWDELLEVIRAFTEDDPDGDGKADTWGWNFAREAPIIIEDMNGCHINNWVKTEDGVFEAGMISKNMYDAMSFMEKIYDGGYCDIEYLSDTSGEERFSQFATGKLGILCCGVNYLSSKVWETLMANEPDAKVAAMPSFTGNGYYQERECNLLNCIPSTCEHPEAALKYLDWMLTDGWSTVKYGQEGVDYQYDGDLIVPLMDSEANIAQKFSYTSEYATLSTYKTTIAMNRATVEALDDSYPTKAALLIQCDAMEATKDIKFSRATPTSDLGLEIVQEYMADMDTIANEYWSKALNDTSYTTDEAWEAIKAEWEGMGYQKVKDAFNAAAKEYGY